MAFMRISTMSSVIPLSFLVTVIGLVVVGVVVVAGVIVVAVGVLEYAFQISQ